MINGSQGPFDIAERGVKPDVACHTLPGEITTLDQAHAAITGLLSAAKRPTIMLFTCSFAAFPDYDGFVAYRASDGSTRVLGHQEKVSRAHPQRAVPAACWIERSLHVRGVAPAEADRLSGWTYLDPSDIQQLLGCSLRRLYPAEWPPAPPAPAPRW
jgi:hypothetical protein